MVQLITKKSRIRPVMMPKTILTPDDEAWEHLPTRTMGYIATCIEQSIQKHKVTADMLDVRAIFDAGRLKMVKIKVKGTL